MAVIPSSLALHWNGSTGSAGESEEYTAVWKLQVDDYRDQAQTVLLWFVANVVNRGDPYTYANDIYPTDSVAQRISADRLDRTVDWWIVTVNYAPDPDEDEEPREDINGEPTDDPIEFTPTMQVGSYTYQRPAFRARLIEGLSGTAATRLPANGWYTPQTSNFVPYDPLPEIDDLRRWVAIGRNFNNFDDSAMAYNVVNDRPLQFTYKGYSFKCPQWGAKIRKTEIEFKRYLGADYIRITLFIDLRGGNVTKLAWGDYYDDFTMFLPDVSPYSRALDSDPDGRGSVYGQGAGQTPIPPDGALIRNIADADGMPLGARVPLDSDGLPVDSASIGEVQLLRWLGYEQRNFADLEFFKGFPKTMMDELTL